jgi:hypothetical protein
VLDEKFIYGKQKTDKGQKHKKNLQADPEATIIKKLDLLLLFRFIIRAGFYSHPYISQLCG